MIIPTVGRMVHFLAYQADGKPQAAIVVDVHSDRLVNLTVFDSNGNGRGRANVVLVQEGDVEPKPPFCRWMPYQVQVAKGQIPAVQHAQPSLGEQARRIVDQETRNAPLPDQTTATQPAQTLEQLRDQAPTA
jgi:hypothetical protein